MQASTALILCAVALLADVCRAGPKELSITTIKEDPYAMYRESKLEGYCMDLLSKLAQKVGFRYNVHLVKDGRYGSVDDRGNWTGMIGEVVRGEADLAVAPLTLTATREQAVEMTTPFMQTGISFVLKKELVTEESSFSLLSPFSRDMWVGLIIAFLLTGLSVFVVARISPCEWAEPETENHSFTLLHSFWYITGALALQGAGPHPKALSGRVISAIWWIFALLLLACYFANLNSMLNADTKVTGGITNFDDLANQDVIDFGTIKSGSSMFFFKNSKMAVYQRIYEAMEKKNSYVSTMAEGIRRVQEGNYAFIGESVSLDLTVARHCQLTRADDVIAMRGYSIAAPLGSPLVKNLTVAILQLSESGELAYLQTKWWHNSCAAGRAQGPSPLQPHTLRGLFLLLGLGLGLGLLLALLELGNKARSHAKDTKKSCCSTLATELSQRFGSRGESATPEASDKDKA